MTDQLNTEQLKLETIDRLVDLFQDALKNDTAVMITNKTPGSRIAGDGMGKILWTEDDYNREIAEWLLQCLRLIQRESEGKIRQLKEGSG